MYKSEKLKVPFTTKKAAQIAQISLWQLQENTGCINAPLSIRNG
jgi:hypothetical protein